ncbi:hypothetical protein CXB42_04990 [Pseudomonas syringae pv. syringae]|uniref:Uncharacterized protein n=1 Tax=Pseudomonas syringae pv. syringae TaxID=321 RepID=A0AAE5S9F3_PSESY|nr:hypothetical protein CXB42_04990 [Pseudomonas syringae pv. syringae]
MALRRWTYFATRYRPLKPEFPSHFNDSRHPEKVDAWRVGEDVQREEIAQEFNSVLEANVGDAVQLALRSFSA